MLEPISRFHKTSIAAILPVYNEAETVGNLLNILKHVDIVDEIIVVDDGSTDDSVDRIHTCMAQDHRLCLIEHKQNKGKGEAVLTGWQSTKASIILLLDTDLYGLNPRHILDLIDPVLDHRADMSIGLFWGGHLQTDLAQWVTPWLTGQRCVRADIFKNVSKKAASGYGLEVALTITARHYDYRTRIVPLKGVWHLPSEVHRGLQTGIRWRGRMYRQIIRAWIISTQQRWPKAKNIFSSISNMQ